MVIMPRVNTDAAKETVSQDVKNISAKRLYRGVMECVRKLDVSRQHRRNLISLFQAEQVKLRHKLREACEKLLFSYPSEYCRRAEELLWRKVYYDVIHAVKAGRKFQSNAPGTLQQRHLEPHYRQFLYSAIGFYHYLLLRLQSKFDCAVLHIDFPLASRGLQTNNSIYAGQHGLASNKPNRENEKELEEWVKNTAYRILVCLGDLSRYQMEFDIGRSRPIRYYQLALLARPNAGMPHNQVATVAGHSSWWGLTAAYHYCRSLHAELSFEGAEGNMQKLLDRTKKLFYQLPTDALDSIVTAPVYKKEHTRIFIISFLYMCDLLRPKTYATDVETTGLCTRLIHAVHVCLNHMDCNAADYLPAREDSASSSAGRTTSYKQRNETKRYGLRVDTNSFDISPLAKTPRHHHRSNQHRLNGDIVFKICVICLVNVHDLQTCRSSRSSAAIVFTLAFFSHLLEFLIQQLTKKRKVKDSTDESISEGEKCFKADGDNVADEEDGNGKSRKGKSRLRRRRRIGGGLNEDDLSEGEEDVMGGGDAAASDSDSSSSHALDESDTLSESSGSENRLSQEDLSSQEDGDLAENDYYASSGATRNHSKEVNPSNDSPPTIAVASLQDLSNKMFQHQPTNRRKITLAPSFLQHLSPANEVKLNKSVDGDSALSVNGVEKEENELPHGGATDDEDEKVEKELKKESAVGDASEKENERLKNDSEELEHLALLARHHHVMAAIKLLSDWLAMNDVVAAACAQNSRALWSRLVCLLNLLPTERAMLRCDDVRGDPVCSKQLENVLQNLEANDEAMKAEAQARKEAALKEASSKEKKIKIEKRKSSVSARIACKKPEWRILTAMPEDYAVHMMKAVKDSAVKTGVDLSRPYVELTDLQQCVVRTCRLRHLCRLLATIDGVDIATEMTANEMGNETFTGPVDEVVDPQMELEAVETMRKTRLMKDMAASRLRNEVQALENSLGSAKTRGSTLCLYLVPDADTLCSDLAHVRRLVSSERFFVVIARTVIDGLDSMKKDQQGARDAIRYLETEFKKSNRFIRAQANDESLRGGFDSEKPKLRRQDLVAWRFYRIIECCRHLVQQEAKKTDTEVKEHAGLVTILTQAKEDSGGHSAAAIATAKSFGIQVTNAGSFCKSWTNSSS